MKVRLVLVLGFMVILSNLASYSLAAENEDARLTAFFQEYLDESFRLRPMDATRLGDHRFDHLLDDVSPAARAGWKKHVQKTLDELTKRIDSKKLSRSGQIDFEIWKHDLDRSLWLMENTRPFEEDARVYNEYISDSTYLLLAQSSLSKPAAVKACVSRMALIPKVVAAAKESLKNPPRVFVETAIRQNRGAIAYYEHGIFELAGENPQLSQLGPAAKQLLPVLKDYQKFLEEDLLPRAKGDWRLGKEKFYRKLDLELNAGLNADEVLHEAETEFARVERDMYVIARQLWSRVYPKKPLPPDDPEGRRSTIARVLNELNQQHGTPEKLVQDARDAVQRIKAFIADKDILRLPNPDHCQVIEMPEFQRGNSVAFLNPAPPLDPHASSIYAVSPPPKDWDTRRVTSFLEEYNRHMLQILTIHEAYPGHYVQLEYSNRHPSLIRRVLYSGVFAEGWAVYTEQMMLDQGYGDGDLGLRLNQLKFYLRAVANAILDHKMHCDGMTDEDARKFLMERVFQSEGEAVGKVIRAKQSSCQLSTYFVGRTAFYRLRQQIEREMGDQFDLGRFHEAVLDHGTLPVKYLPELVRERLQKPR
ncbi:MAG TPA: DUF885 domain-containing protein [Gemmataceae bacterium]|nr:DUF885 domain-containing protein [Gemmataceae bacterium]